jgi:hypothetical protein
MLLMDLLSWMAVFDSLPGRRPPYTVVGRPAAAVAVGSDPHGAAAVLVPVILCFKPLQDFHVYQEIFVTRSFTKMCIHFTYMPPFVCYWLEEITTF